jgi:hypothetical protein
MTKSTNLNPQAQSQELVRAAIEQTLQKLSTAFREHDASALSGIYAGMLIGQMPLAQPDTDVTRLSPISEVSSLIRTLLPVGKSAHRNWRSASLLTTWPSPRRTWKFKDNKRSQVAYSRCEGITRSKY